MVHSTSRKPSSSTDGFFQSIPTVPPAYTFVNDGSANSSSLAASDDSTLARILNLYLPPESSVGVSVHNLSRRALDPVILNLATDAEVNPPIIRPLTTFGNQNRVDPLITGEGWRKLKTIGQEEGLVTAGYDKSNEQWNRRVHQFALNHVWSPSSAMTGCPASMTDGAAKLLEGRLDDVDGDQPGRRAVIQEAYRRLVSNDPSEAWTSGQWMTERTGGSDVRETETLARRLTTQEISQDVEQGRDVDAHGLQLGPWHIDGFKWFSSATDSDMALLLAQTDKGLSLFFVPMRRSSGKQSNASELNGIRIQRLKNKLGTKSLPTAELELKGGVAGWSGKKERASMLSRLCSILHDSIARVHQQQVGAVGYQFAGRTFASVRRVERFCRKMCPMCGGWQMR